MAGGKHASRDKSFEDLEFNRKEFSRRRRRFEENDEDDEESDIHNDPLESEEDDEDDDYFGDEPVVDYKKIIIIVVAIIVVLAIIFGVYKLISGNKNTPVEPGETQTEKMPTSISGYKVLGQIVIKDLNVEQYILNLPEEEALKNGVVKLYGASLNSHGNFCIAGHNYEGMFKDIEKLNVGDKIIIKDARETEYEYKVTNVSTVDPDNLECLLQNKDKVEITLITCSTGATSRVIVKAEQVAKDNG